MGRDEKTDPPAKKSSLLTLFFALWIGAFVVGGAYVVYWASVEWLNQPHEND